MTRVATVATICLPEYRCDYGSSADLFVIYVRLLLRRNPRQEVNDGGRMDCTRGMERNDIENGTQL